jgi:hypothetical protein
MPDEVDLGRPGLLLEPRDAGVDRGEDLLLRVVEEE